MTPEEKLLRAIFGEKASDVRDTSLKVPPGVSGTIVDVRVFSEEVLIRMRERGLLSGLKLKGLQRIEMMRSKFLKEVIMDV